MHKDNKDISSKSTRLPPGDTREVVRKNRSEALSDERAAAKEKRPVMHGNIDHQVKTARVAGMRLHMEKQNLDSIIAQIDVMRENEHIYKTIYREDKYHQKIVELMNKLSGMGTTNATTECVANTTLDDDVEDDDDFQ